MKFAICEWYFISTFKLYLNYIGNALVVNVLKCFRLKCFALTQKEDFACEPLLSLFGKIYSIRTWVSHSLSFDSPDLREMTEWHTPECSSVVCKTGTYLRLGVGPSEGKCPFLGWKKFLWWSWYIFPLKITAVF